MNVYVAEISGRGIAAFDAADDADAQLHLADKSFVRDLIVLQNQGRPLWDGVSKIQLRNASAEEAIKWQSGLVVGDEDRVVFLVPVVDPSGAEFHDDDDDGDDDHDHDHGD
jgi:hypothetical protein